MKQIITTTLCCLVLISSLVKAQEPDTAQAAETILKLENPYKKGKTKWLNENGFNTSTYGWDDPSINLYLDQAIKNRSIGNVLGYTGGGIFLFGLLGNFAGRMAYEISNNDPDRQFQITKAPYYIGGVIIASSVTLHINALSKLKKAKNVRERKFSN